MKIIAQNKKAFHDYEILERMEAGIVLTGDEVKSLRAGNVSLIGAFANFKDGELYLNNCKISHYERAFSKADEQASTRPRKLLLHRKQLAQLFGDVSRKGITVVPLKMYFNNKNIAKVELGIAKHKKAPDKKKALKERDIKREMSREIKER